MTIAAREMTPEEIVDALIESDEGKGEILQAMATMFERGRTQGRSEMQDDVNHWSRSSERLGDALSYIEDMAREALTADADAAKRKWPEKAF